MDTPNEGLAPVRQLIHAPDPELEKLLDEEAAIQQATQQWHEPNYQAQLALDVANRRIDALERRVVIALQKILLDEDITIETKAGLIKQFAWMLS